MDPVLLAVISVTVTMFFGVIYVGNGVRTRNGVVQTFRGDTHGETAYGGTILRIADLNAVSNTTNSAGFYPAFPNESTYSDWIDGTWTFSPASGTRSCEIGERVAS